MIRGNDVRLPRIANVFVFQNHRNIPMEKRGDEIFSHIEYLYF